MHSGADGLSCKIFLLSGYEVGATTADTSYLPIDGAKLSYFTLGTAGNSLRIAKFNGSNDFWWLRSASNMTNDQAFLVNNGGGVGRTRTDASHGVRPACVLPQNLTVKDDGTLSFEPINPESIIVPGLAMQGNQITVSWSAVDGADGYILERKANTDSDWTQVYSGANLTFSETVGTWTSVQYRVTATSSFGNSDYTTSASVPVVSASILVISGTDGDLGTLVNDVPYTVSSSGTAALTVTETINGMDMRTYTAANGATNKISVVDLPTGSGTIKITASTNPGSGVVTVTREWTYTKTTIIFPDTGSVAQLTQQGENIWAKTLAEAVRMPGGMTLDRFIAAMVITLTTSGWTQSGGVYTQTVDCPIVWPYAPIVIVEPDLTTEDQSADDAVLAAWQSGPGAKGMKQGDGEITFYAASQPTMNIPVRVGVI